MKFKKGLFSISLAVVSVTGLMLTMGFGGVVNWDTDDWCKQGNEVRTKVAVIEGHRYVLAKTIHGVAVVHAESCGCGR